MRSTLAFVLTGFLVTGPLLSDEVLTIPSGTAIYGELDETVTSRKKETTVGDIVRARVWRNVVVNGHTVIKAGEPMLLKVSVAKPAKIAGRKGQLELEAISTRTINGDEILLDGGYDKSGKGRKALSITLFAVVAWPLIFIKGKQAELPTGTVFDGVIQADTPVTIASDEVAAVKVRLGGFGPSLTLDPLYDEMDESGKSPDLPVAMELCDAGPLETAAVVTVNGKDVPHLPLELGETTQEGECSASRAIVNLKRVGEHFVKGINRFEVEAGGARAEIVLDVEL